MTVVPGLTREPLSRSVPGPFAFIVIEVLSEVPSGLTSVTLATKSAKVNVTD